MTLPRPERDVPAVRTLDGLAPKFRASIALLLTHFPEAMIAETLRTPERQSFLYGFGRDYDDGRGIVTQAPTHLTSFHGFGLAADLVHAKLGWGAPRSWFAHLADVAETYGLKWGGRWRHPDLPHFYWGGCPDSPTYIDRGLLASKGIEAVWASRGAL